MAGLIVILVAAWMAVMLLILAAGRSWQRVKVHVPRFNVRKANRNREMRQLDRFLTKLRDVTETERGPRS